MIDYTLVFLIGQSMILMAMEGGEGGGANDSTANEESNENAILPSHDDQGHLWRCRARLKNAQLSSAVCLLQRKRKRKRFIRG